MMKQGFHNSNYELNRPLPKTKRKKVIELKKDELDEKLIKKLLD